MLRNQTLGKFNQNASQQLFLPTVKNFTFLSTGSFFQTLGKFNQNASQKESVI